MHTQISPSKINLNPLSCKITGKSLIIQCTLKNGTCMENKWIKCKVDTRGRWFLHWIHTEYMNWANSITFTLKRNLIRLTIIDFVYVSRTLSLHFYCKSLVSLLNITDINVELKNTFYHNKRVFMPLFYCTKFKVTKIEKEHANHTHKIIVPLGYSISL